MRRVLLLVAAGVLLGVGIFLALGEEDVDGPAPEAVVEIGGATVRADVADDEASRRRGLAGRAGLEDDEGMLFLLPDDSPAFWMKGMRFPIDIVWIDDGRVVDVTADVPPPRESESDAALPTYSPRRPANRALEVNAGWAARHGVTRGDVVRVRRDGGSG
jgi:uncharacterized membrane protein (UPF0127 family)